MTSWNQQANLIAGVLAREANRDITRAEFAAIPALQAAVGEVPSGTWSPSNSPRAIHAEVTTNPRLVVRLAPDPRSAARRPLPQLLGVG